jgi:hypothetical protein
MQGILRLCKTPLDTHLVVWLWFGVLLLRDSSPCSWCLPLENYLRTTLFSLGLFFFDRNLPSAVLIPNQINEGQTIQLKATAKDGGSSDNLTYTWDLGDGSQPVIGQNITHQFVDNGTYNVNLTVTDFDGGITQQSTQIKVDNVAPTATITTPNTTLNQGETLNLGVNYRDAGIKDTHTITWNFGDGTAPVTLVGALGFEAQPNLLSHVFTLCTISWF